MKHSLRKDVMSMPDLPRRLTRAESFLGVHFDFHADDKCRRIGARTTERMIEAVIKQVRPDYVQCDCKGHPGWCSYPTRVGYAHPDVVGDPLRTWRKVTARRGVALYMHYSGVWDAQAIKRHPSWASVNSDGKRDKNITSTFGPYVDKLLIPQLKELCDEYGVDGVWVDGDCWAMGRDYSREALARFRKETGISKVPRKPEDAYFFEFTEFCRESFRRYLRHYISAMRAHNPAFQVTSNWAFSSHMPEPVSADVDFLSGDLLPTDSVNSARWDGRCLAHQGKAWDLMAWSFKNGVPRTTKTIPQLQREAAIVLSLGGGFQAYFTQRRDGSIVEWQIKLMAETARFCRERQAICHRAKSVPQIALLHSTTGHYRGTQRLFDYQDCQGIRGILSCLLDSQCAVDILSEHHLRGRMKDFPLVVVPEWACLEKPFIAELMAYVKAGGRLLAIGPKAVNLFRTATGVKCVGKPVEKKDVWLEHAGWLGGLSTTVQVVKPGNAGVLGRLFDENDTDSAWSPATTVTKYGKGLIGAVHCNIGTSYSTARTSVLRDFLGAVVQRLFPNPLVTITGSRSVDVTINRIAGKLAINLVNTSGPHADKQVAAFDEITPIGPLQVAIRFPHCPRSVMWAPENRQLAHSFGKGVIRLTLPRLEIHGVIVVE